MVRYSSSCGRSAQGGAPAPSALNPRPAPSPRRQAPRPAPRPAPLAPMPLPDLDVAALRRARLIRAGISPVVAAALAPLVFGEVAR
ncbi:hypothetical protein M446_6921 [Methylobacterium sp. 4-46]|nr:hypothetical protein M446_6921 [Methylobacterium sp. 4-46]